MAQQHHTLDYIELPAPDLAAVTEFYSAAFGWSFNDYGGAYAGIVSPDGNGEVGGFNPEGTPQPAGVLVQLYSDDLEASRDAVVAAGGRIVQDIFSFPGGRRFQFADPAGNELGVWTTSEGDG